MRPEVKGEVIPQGEVLRVLRVEHTGGLLRGSEQVWYHVSRDNGTTAWLNSNESADWTSYKEDVDPSEVPEIPRVPAEIGDPVENGQPGPNREARSKP